MRKILFRGQTRKFGEKVRMGDGQKLPGHWVYGGVLQGKSSHSIIYGGENADDQSEGLDKWCVHTDTIGQFTGLTDKNGKKIFEGDIIHAHYANAPKADFVEQVVFSDGRFCSLFSTTDGSGKMWSALPLSAPHIKNDKSIYMEWCEVIGNIHDNPELLKEGAEDGN